MVNQASSGALCGTSIVMMAGTGLALVPRLLAELLLLFGTLIEELVGIMNKRFLGLVMMLGIMLSWPGCGKSSTAWERYREALREAVVAGSKGQSPNIETIKRGDKAFWDLVSEGLLIESTEDPDSSRLYVDPEEDPSGADYQYRPISALTGGQWPPGLVFVSNQLDRQ